MPHCQSLTVASHRRATAVKLGAQWAVRIYAERMRLPEPISPALWVNLTLPSNADLSGSLVELLSEMRIPAAVRHSVLFGSGTLAMVPADAGMSVLAMTDGFGPWAEWVRTDEEQLIAALDALAGPGTLLDDEPFVARRSPRAEPDAVVAAPVATRLHDSAASTAVVWTTRWRRDEIAILGARLGMAFESADAGRLGLALKPADPAHVDEIMTNMIWALGDGVAVWQAGEESVAAFVRHGVPTFAFWDAPWSFVDPSRPGQTADGVALSSRLRDATAREHDPAAWIKHFRLDEQAGAQLRALFRRDPHPGVLSDLLTILGLPDGWLRLLSDSPEDTERIEPRGTREALADEMQQILRAAAPAPSTFRFRHPRWWLAISLCAISVLAGYALFGITAGRMTAFLPAVGGAIWAVSLAVDGAFGRALRPVAPPACPDDPGAER